MNVDYLFLEPQPVTDNLGKVKSLVCFSNGLPVICRFKNGLYCRACGCLTEHSQQRIHGHLVFKCLECNKASVIPLDAETIRKKAISDRQRMCFENAISHYSKQIEREALEPILGNSDFRRLLLPTNYAQFRSHDFEVRTMKMKIKKGIDRFRKTPKNKNFAQIETLNILKKLEACS